MALLCMSLFSMMMLKQSKNMVSAGAFNITMVVMMAMMAMVVMLADDADDGDAMLMMMVMLVILVLIDGNSIAMAMEWIDGDVPGL